MTDRDELRRQKQAQCDRRIAELHKKVPRLQQIADKIAEIALVRLKSAVKMQTPVQLAALDKEMQELFRERKEILAALGLDESVYEPLWDCPICHDLGYVTPGVPCQCVLNEKKQDELTLSGITPALREKCFANFKCEYYTEPEKMAQKVEQCQKAARKIINDEPCENFVFTGDVGRGKTHLSLAVANEVFDHGKKVIYKRTNDLLEEIRTAKYENHEENALEKFIACDLLVIDDFGADTASDFAKSQLRILLEERNLNHKAWIISTNLSLNMIEDIYSPRIADRLLENARIFSFESPRSIREILRAERLG